MGKREACKHCGGGSIDMAMHEENCVSKPSHEPEDTVLYDVYLENGKYRFVYHYDAKPPEAYRYGERWPAFEAIMLGSKAIMLLVARIDELDPRDKLEPYHNPDGN